MRILFSRIEAKEVNKVNNKVFRQYNRVYSRSGFYSTDTDTLRLTRRLEASDRLC